MDKIDYEMYKHLPFPELFAKHQSYFLNQNDWINIVKTIQNKKSEVKDNE